MNEEEQEVNYSINDNLPTKKVNNYNNSALDSSSQNTKQGTSHKKPNNMTESIVFDNTNSDLHKTIPSGFGQQQSS